MKLRMHSSQKNLLNSFNFVEIKKKFITYLANMVGYSIKRTFNRLNGAVEIVKVIE